MNEREAFFQVVSDATPARTSYISLYVNEQYYGGPEEGGWWGQDTKLVAFRECTNEVEALAIRNKVDVLAVQLTRESKDNFGQACKAECEWLESRGLDADFLPEVNGPDRYWVTDEDHPGSLVSQGSRHYE